MRGIRSPWRTANRIDGARSIESGAPPIGEGKVNCPEDMKFALMVVTRNDTNVEMRLKSQERGLST